MLSQEERTICIEAILEVYDTKVQTARPSARFPHITFEDAYAISAGVAARQQAATKKRRYLTEPPSEYNAPAETAAVGNLGEEELSEEAIARQKARKKKKGFFDGLFGS